MRKILLLLSTLLFPLGAFSQNSSLLNDAQDLFASGDYSAAVTKFQEAVNKLSGRERNIAQIQLSMAQTCVTALSKAKTAESSQDYVTAISEYQKVLDANPNDIRVKELQDAARRAKQEEKPTLIVSKNSFRFSSSGGTQKITVSCNVAWTLVDQSSSMCTVHRSGDEITISCLSNYSSLGRDTFFTVMTTDGKKEQRIYVFQSGHSYSSTSPSNLSSSTQLSVNQTSIYVPATEGTVNVLVDTNANDYTVSLLPNWCTIKNKYKTYFTLSYDDNTGVFPREEWFIVNAGNKTIRITISQSANNTVDKYNGIAHSQPRNSVKNNRLFRIGLDASLYFDCNHYRSNPPLEFGVGLKARFGRSNQWLNFIGGAKYLYYNGVSGVMFPIMLNINLLKREYASLYLGGGYEFGSYNIEERYYRGVGVFQMGICGPQYDLNMFYKFDSGVIGTGFTIYF